MSMAVGEYVSVSSQRDAEQADVERETRELSLAALGEFGGHLGGAPLGRAALRVTLGGALAMAVTAAIGRIVGVAMG
jgi:VIT1/CCC1 family predicted Fe2+/Mn2+ transporter